MSDVTLEGVYSADAVWDHVADAVADGRRLSGEEFALLCSRAGRVHGPELLWECWREELIDNAVVTAEIAGIWSGADYPEAALGPDNWLELFEAAGFTRDGERARRPRKPVTLYRGAVPGRKTGMAWTSEPDEACRFADGSYRRPPGRVYVTEAPPKALLCIVGDAGRGEAEYVINPRGLDIREHADGDTSS